jgi:HAD superfamily hydrolase (TIGR01509 family)
MSNIMPGLLQSMQHLDKLPNLPYDSIIDSSVVGAIKPEAKIYEIAQQKAGCPAEEILLIDDSRVNLMAAEKMNWHVIWFDDSSPVESVDRIRQALQPS